MGYFKDNRLARNVRYEDEGDAYRTTQSCEDDGVRGFV